MEASPLVSIVVPTYNRPKYLMEAVRSALAQTYPHVEVVVVDDASPEDPQAALQALRDSRVRYLRNEANVGVVENWKRAIRAAKGAFFCVLGDDDALEPTFVERLLPPLLEDASLALGFSDHYVMDAESNLLLEKTEENASEWGRSDLPGGKVSDYAQTILIDRSAFITAVLFRTGAFDPATMDAEARGFIDYWMYYQTYRQRGDAYYVPECLVRCRWQVGGVSRNLNWRRYMMRGEIFCYHHMLRDRSLERFWPLLRRRMAVSMSSCGNSLLAIGEREEARGLLVRSLRIGPSKKAIIGLLLSFLGDVGSSLAATIQRQKATLHTRNAS